MLRDVTDTTAQLSYATEGEEVIGTLCLNFGADAPFSAESELCFDLARFRSVLSDAQMGIFTRFAVRKPYRATRLPLQIMAEAALIALQLNVDLAFCDCQPHLIGLYRSLGFRSYTNVYNSQQAGILLPLALVAGDMEYLRNIKSPLLRFIPPMVPRTQVVEQILPLLKESNAHNHQADAAADQWVDVYSLLSEREGRQVHLFDGLTQDEIGAIIAKGQVIACGAGDRVIGHGQVTSTLFVVLAGAAEVRVENRIIRVVTAGNIIGEVAFLLGIPRTADVYAVGTGARILSLHEKTLRNLTEGASRINAIVLHNLAKLLALKLAETASRADIPLNGDRRGERQNSTGRTV